MINSEFFKKVKNLNLPRGEYALFGSAPLVIRGLKESDDIDIIATENLYNHCKQSGWEEKIAGSGSLYLTRDEIELFKDWKPGEWDIQELIDGAEVIDGLPFVKLVTVLKWKKLRNKEKDKKDIEIIEKYLIKKTTE